MNLSQKAERDGEGGQCDDGVRFESTMKRIVQHWTVTSYSCLHLLKSSQ